ncbi:MAG: prepilin-type N-terminal cleavage/methylation domain-containing protein, partial [Actinomycetes bacterium]
PRSKRQEGLTLVELVVGMVILGIVSTMLFTTWFSLSRSYAYSVNSSIARDDARQAISRMEREIRDAESSPITSTPAIIEAHPYWICMFTTFNDPSSSTPATDPHLVAYRLYTDNTLWRFEDTDGSGTIGGIVMEPVSGASPNVGEKTTGEGRMLLCGSVVNLVNPATPLFMYNYYSASGDLLSVDDVSSANNQTARIVAVQTHLRVDLSPTRSPVYTDFLVTATLRN